MTVLTKKGPVEVKKEIDFTNMMCDLEDNGVDVMAFLDEEKRRGMKVFSVMRAIFGVLVDEKDLRNAGKQLSEHLASGGSLDDVMNAFNDAMIAAGFGGAPEEDAKISEKAQKTQ